MTAAPATAQHTGPFTAANLREMVARFPWGNRYHAPPGRQLTQMVTMFNMIDHSYKNREVANTNQVRAAEVRHALWVLMRFFTERRRECGVPGIEPRVVKRELGLCDLFDNLKDAMTGSSGTFDEIAPNDSPGLTYMLPMDAGLGARPYKNWYDFAHWIAHAWELVMKKANPGKKLGLTARPIIWLTAETIEVIVGKGPSTSTIAQHLKRPYKPKRRAFYR
jgi:hypothetical protein